MERSIKKANIYWIGLFLVIVTVLVSVFLNWKLLWVIAITRSRSEDLQALLIDHMPSGLKKSKGHLRSILINVKLECRSFSKCLKLYAVELRVSDMQLYLDILNRKLRYDQSNAKLSIEAIDGMASIEYLACLGVSRSRNPSRNQAEVLTRIFSQLKGRPIKLIEDTVRDYYDKDPNHYVAMFNKSFDSAGDIVDHHVNNALLTISRDLNSKKSLQIIIRKLEKEQSVLDTNSQKKNILDLQLKYLKRQLRFVKLTQS